MQLFYGLIFILNIIFSENSLNFFHKVNCLSTDGNLREPLILTPLIENGNITFAQNLSSVKPLKGDIVSYSGFLTVNKQYNSNMFFWFFPAVNNTADAPIILWLDGGPGATSMLGLFAGSGPFYINKKGELKSRKYTWTTSHSVIYIDNPVGSGYSFTEQDQGYSRNEVDVGKNLYTALLQFFQLFPQYQKNDFYIAGESYAGKFVPAVAYTIHNNNPKANLKINLKGIAMGNAFCDPEHMTSTYGDYLYQLGLIDGPGRDIFHFQEQRGLAYIKQQNWIAATDVFGMLLEGDPKNPSIFFNLTGFKNNFNYLDSNGNILEIFETLIRFVTKDNVREAIHVGNATFNDGIKVAEFMKEDIMQSVKPWVEVLLEHYKVVSYSGQLDLIVAYPYSLKFYNALNWSGAVEYKTATRNKWYVGKALAGYAKTVKNFTEILVRNAGHLVIADQPFWALDLITRITTNKPF